MSDDYAPMTTDDARLLFVAILDQAAGDACAEPPTSNSLWAKRERRELVSARSWIRGNGPEYRAVCDLASIDPDRIRANLISGELKKVRDSRVTHKRRLSRGFDKDKKVQFKKGIRDETQ